MSRSSEDVLAAARGGDESAFESLVVPYRGELHAHCYRMLGSVHDAEDVLQEVLLRAWRGLAGFEGRSSVRGWLYRIATNTCLNAIESRALRVLPVDLTASGDQPLVEQMWIEPYPDVAGGVGAPAARYEHREALELAFVAALQYLPGRQRAALILRDVLGFSARDAADALGTTTVAVNSALVHARRNVEERIPRRSQQATLRAMGDARLREVVERYMRAFEDADIHAMVAMLAADATWSMPPLAEWYRGHGAIEAFLLDGPLTTRWRHLPTVANGQPAVGCYAWDEASGRYRATVVDVLTFDGELIAAVTAFIDDTLFERLGLPSDLPPDHVRTDRPPAGVHPTRP